MSINTPATGEFRQIPLAQLRFSKTAAQTERRAHFDKTGLKELADSITAVGIAQPILVRRVTFMDSDRQLPDEQRMFEVVAGERRVVAAKQAGLKEVPAMVREISDEQLLELQLVENLQRQDVHPMAEAEGYEALRKLGRTVDEIADKVGKSKAYVYARMKLLELVKEARTAYYDDKLTSSTALYVARIPASLQKQAVAEITKPQGWGDNKAPMSARAAAAHIHANYMLRLSDAGFKTEDPKLVPAAGACGACPKRTGNQPQLFGDVKGADVCTDPVCFRQKVAAHAERAIAAAAERGQKVITGKEAEKITKHGTADHTLENAGLVRLDARDYEGKSTYRKTLGKDYVPTLLQDPTGKLIEVAPAKDIDKARGNRKATSISRESERQVAQRRAGEAKHKADINYRRALAKAIAHASSKLKALLREDYERIAERMLDRLDHDGKKRLFSLLGWDYSRKDYSLVFKPPTPIAKMTLEHLLQFIRMLSIAHELQVWQHSGETKPKDMEALASMIGVDMKAVRAAAMPAKKPAKKKARK